ncbi:MAG: RCKP-type rubredoxin-like domain-containing protein [Actinomycetota bacterium]
MAIWKCLGCGAIKEGRCKPRKCENCGGTKFQKVESK